MSHQTNQQTVEEQLIEVPARRGRPKGSKDKVPRSERAMQPMHHSSYIITKVEEEGVRAFLTAVSEQTGDVVGVSTFLGIIGRHHAKATEQVAPALVEFVKSERINSQVITARAEANKLRKNMSPEQVAALIAELQRSTV